MKRKITFVKNGRRWFPMAGDLVDLRGGGFSSMQAVLDWKNHREEYTGETIQIEFRK